MSTHRSSKSHFSAADLSRQVKVDEQLTSVCATLGVSGRTAEPADVVRTNRRFGVELRPITAEAISTVHRCRGPFQKLPFTTESLQDQLARLADLENADAALERTRHKVRDEINALRVRIGGAVGLIEDTTRATLAHPFWDPQEKAQLDTAAQPFLRAISARAETITAASVSTRTRNAATTAQLGEAQAQAARLAVENKFLSGEGLRPSDLGVSAPPPAARRARARKARR